MKGAFAVDPCPPTPPATCPPNTNSKFTPGFPGFGPISAAQTLAYVADMQEVGVPITYGYISDAHEKKSAAGVTQTRLLEQRHGSGAWRPLLRAEPAELQHGVQDVLPAARRRRDRQEQHALRHHRRRGRPLRRRERNPRRPAHLRRSARGLAEQQHLRLLRREQDRRDAGQHPRAAAEPAEQHDAVLRRAPGELDLHHGQPGAERSVHASARAGLLECDGERRLRRQRPGEPDAVRGGSHRRAAPALRQRRREPDAVVHGVPEARLLPHRRDQRRVTGQLLPVRGEPGQCLAEVHDDQQRLRLGPWVLRTRDRQHVPRARRARRRPQGRRRLGGGPGPELGRHGQLQPAARDRRSPTRARGPITPTRVRRSWRSPGSRTTTSTMDAS